MSSKDTLDTTWLPPSDYYQTKKTYNTVPLGRVLSGAPLRSRRLENPIHLAAMCTTNFFKCEGKGHNKILPSSL
jgi:hypothetical protein